MPRDDSWIQGPPTEAGDYWCWLQGHGFAEFVDVEEIDADEGDFRLHTSRGEISFDDILFHQPAMPPEPPEGR
jgi:hypothetical protein